MDPTPEHARTLIRGGWLYSVHPAGAPVRGDLLVENGRIARCGKVRAADAAGAEVVDASDCVVLPGFVQTHVHLCQTLFRALAERRELIAWLRDRIWPMEAAHDPVSLAASVRLGALELLLGGTTCVQDMGTVHHQDAVFEALAESGLRAVAGKAMMDAADDRPTGLCETTDASLAESIALCERWHGARGDRLRYAFAPRFALSATEPLLRAVAAEIESRPGVGVHTHAAESRLEGDMIERAVGRGVVRYFDDVGLLGDRLRLAHCVWITQRDREALADTRTKAVHCPGSNLKLGSGICDVVALRDAGVDVSLGTDGGACNNSLDIFAEMRLAALLPSFLHEPGALTSEEIIEMATLGGARALGWDADIGSLEVGKRADVIVVRLDAPHLSAGDDASLADRLVFSARGSDVDTVLVDGVALVRGGHPTHCDAHAVRRAATDARRALLARAEL